jgi:hypothetical protein
MNIQKTLSGEELLLDTYIWPNCHFTPVAVLSARIKSLSTWGKYLIHKNLSASLYVFPPENNDLYKALPGI